MSKRSPTDKIVLNRNHSIIMQLYYLNKTQLKKEAKLPLNDFRRQVTKKKTFPDSVIYIHSLKKAMLRIAALW